LKKKYEGIGNRLKKKADSDGKIVSVRINNLYGLLQSLSRFFYRKHHEWIALAFVREDYSTRKIWFNKGSNRKHAQYGLDPPELLKYARRFDAELIIDGHNHPVSSKDIPDYGSRRANIAATYRQKEASFGFSDTDNASTANYSTFLEDHGIKHADVVYVAGDYQIRGDQEVIDRFSREKKEAKKSSRSSRDTNGAPTSKNSGGSGNSENADCFIVTLCYGRGSDEYRRMIDLRDNFLSDYLLGRLAVKWYYGISPWLVKIIGKSNVLTRYSKKVVKWILFRLEDLRDLSDR